MATLMLLTSRLLVAQADFEKGYQAYQSYHGSDFDTVNLANGNLILDIPLLSYQQRGGLPPLVVSIRSNSTTFQSTPQFSSGPLDTKQHEVSGGIVGAPWGQPHVVIGPGGLSWKEERVTAPSHLGIGGPQYLSRYIAIDDSGASHSLGGSVANLAAGNVSGIMYSVDGSGLMLQPGTALTGQVIVDRQGNIGGLVDPNGNAIALNGQCATAPGSGDLFNASLASWEGYAHGIASATSVTDSVQRFIPNPSYVPPAVPYSCIIDLDQSYYPASAPQGGCETWNFPAEGSGTIPLTFCYEKIPVSGVIPTPFAPGTQIPGGGSTTGSCTVLGAVGPTSCEPTNETWWVLTSVTLPNNTQWVFGYDAYGQVQSVTTPTGAAITYTYATRISCGNPPGETPVTGDPTWPYSNIMSSRMVVSRMLDVKDLSAPKTWTYNSMIGSGWTSSPNSGQVTVNDPDGNDTVHTFSLIGQSVCGPYETSTQYYQGLSASGQQLKQVDTVYTNTGLDYANPTNFSNYLTVGVFPQVVTTGLPATTGSNSVVSQDISTYDSYYQSSGTYVTFGTYQDYVGNTHPFSFGQMQSVSETDWGTPTQASQGTLPVLRTTLHTHLWQFDWSYYAANLIDLPCLETVFSSPTTVTQPSCAPQTPATGQVSQTSYAYDEPLYTPGYSGIRGNATSVNHWLQGSANPISTHNLYNYSLNPYGMPTEKMDADGFLTLLTYGCSGSLLSAIQHPTTNTNGQAIYHIEHPTYDCNTGLLTSHIDENGQTTSYTYDSMRRLRTIAFPDGGSETYTYHDVMLNPYFTYQKALSSIQTPYTATGFADGLGRIAKTQVTAPEGTITKDTLYDNLGRVATVSNPYIASGTGAVSYAYDALGRKTAQCQQDNGSAILLPLVPNVPQPCVVSNSALTWQYAGNVTTSFDELGNAWTRTSDGLGRLTYVTEPDGLTTSYTYDALGNLTSVVQPGAAGAATRNRSFTYDTLSRLLTSTNPETGTICYGVSSGGSCTNGYDPNGNLLHKTDARGIVTNYAYDPLNRLQAKWYTNDSTGTPTSCYQYDVSPLSPPNSNLLGRLTNAWTQKGSCYSSTSGSVFQASTTLSLRSIIDYDPMGRILDEQQCTFSNCATPTRYAPSYDYDLAGNLIHHSNGMPITSPANVHELSFTNCYDEAARLTLVLIGSNTCASPTLTTTNILFTSPAYSPAGGLTAATFGTGLTLSRTYDIRLRVSGENDLGNTQQPATPGTTTIHILGTTDQTH